MIIICAWCGKMLGEKEPLEDKTKTHTVCEKCYEKMRRTGQRTRKDDHSGSKGENP